MCSLPKQQCQVLWAYFRYLNKYICLLKAGKQENLLLHRSWLSDTWSENSKETLGGLQNDVLKFSAHSSTHWKILLEKSSHVHSQIQPCNWRLIETFHQLQLSYLPRPWNHFSGCVAIFWHFKSSLWEIFSKSRAEMEWGINKEKFCLILAVYLQIQKPFNFMVSSTYPNRWVWFA